MLAPGSHSPLPMSSGAPDHGMASGPDKNGGLAAYAPNASAESGARETWHQGPIRAAGGLTRNRRDDRTDHNITDAVNPRETIPTHPQSTARSPPGGHANRRPRGYLLDPVPVYLPRSWATCAVRWRYRPGNHCLLQQSDRTANPHRSWPVSRPADRDSVHLVHCGTADVGHSECPARERAVFQCPISQRHHLYDSSVRCRRIYVRYRRNRRILKRPGRSCGCPAISTIWIDDRARLRNAHGGDVRPGDVEHRTNVGDPAQLVRLYQPGFGRGTPSFDLT